MKWKTWSMIALMATSVAAGGCDDDDNADMDWSQPDKDFVRGANEANHAEIDAGTMAASKGEHNAIKMFGNHMVTEHQQALDELKSLADNKDFNLMDTLNAEHRQLKQKLTSLSGHAFDTVYINSQVKDHRKVIAMFERQAANGTDQSLKDYATKYLPHLREHLEHADSTRQVVMEDHD